MTAAFITEQNFNNKKGLKRGYFKCRVCRQASITVSIYTKREKQFRCYLRMLIQGRAGAEPRVNPPVRGSER